MRCSRHTAIERRAGCATCASGELASWMGFAIPNRQGLTHLCHTWRTKLFAERETVF